jgi:hypothetical protein
MNHQQHSGGAPAWPVLPVDLGPLEKTYITACDIMKCGQYWMASHPPGDIGDWNWTDHRWFHLYVSAMDRDLAWRSWWFNYPVELVDLIQAHTPTIRALDNLEIVVLRHLEIPRDSQGGPTLSVEQAEQLVREYVVACDVIGDALADLKGDVAEPERESDREILETLRPEWDREAKQLRYGETLCREYRRAAPAQFQILDQFQVREWPRTVLSPWNDEKKLRDTVGHLNDNHNPGSLIRFEVFNMKPAWLRIRPRSGSLQIR